LNLANPTDELQIEAEDDYRICPRCGSAQESKTIKRQGKMLQDDEEDERLVNLRLQGMRFTSLNRQRRRFQDSQQTFAVASGL